MPKYDYGCPNCAAVYEVEHKMEDKIAVVCWHCEGEQVCKRIYTSAPGVVLKGKGWGSGDRQE